MFDYYEDNSFFDNIELAQLFPNAIKSIIRIASLYYNKKIKFSSFLMASTPNKVCKMVVCKHFELKDNQSSIDEMLSFIAEKNKNKYKVGAVSFVTLGNGVDFNILNTIITENDLDIDFHPDDIFQSEDPHILNCISNYIENNKTFIIVRAKVFNCYGQAINVSFVVDEMFIKNGELKFQDDPYLTEDLYGIQWELAPTDKNMLN